MYYVICHCYWYIVSIQEMKQNQALYKQLNNRTSKQAIPGKYVKVKCVKCKM